MGGYSQSKMAKRLLSATSSSLLPCSIVGSMGCSLSVQTSSSLGSPQATVPSGHVHLLCCGVLQGLLQHGPPNELQGYQLHCGLSRGYREVTAPLGSLQGLRTISALHLLCLAQGSPASPHSGHPSSSHPH